MTVAVPTITDVVFDFCGVLLDWRTRACLEGRFDDATVDRICADDDPCGFFGYEDRMDAGEDFDSIWPDVVAEQGERVAGIFRYYIAHYDDALPRMLPGMERLLLKVKSVDCWGTKQPNILVVAPPPIGAGFHDAVMGDGCVEKSAGVAEQFRIICARQNVHFLDAKNCEYNQVDFMHLTCKGHAQLAEMLAKEVPALL